MEQFKKLLSKRRTKLKEIDVSGAAADPVNKARKYQFGGNELAIEIYYITLKISLSPGNKSGDGFNFCLQKSIFRWGPSLRSF